nr:hypothetical protein [Tanacetum cinerariifolium]
MNKYKRRMQTKIELALEQSQQGVSNDALVAVSSSLRLLKPNVHKLSLEPIRDQVKISLGHNPCITLGVHHITTFGTKSVLQPRSSKVRFINHMLILKLLKLNKESSTKEIVSHMILQDNIIQECQDKKIKFFAKELAVKDHNIGGDSPSPKSFMIIAATLDMVEALYCLLDFLSLCSRRWKFTELCVLHQSLAMQNALEIRL